MGNVGRTKGKLIRLVDEQQPERRVVIETGESRGVGSDVGVVPEARSERWVRGHQPPLPTWLEKIRDDQWDSVQEITSRFRDGAKVVFFDAPTGTGKSLIGELVRRELEVRQGLYVCSTKSLQDQYARDFDYAKVLKGRANYTPTTQQRHHQQQRSFDRALQSRITCADCDRSPGGAPREDQSCTWCEFVEDCPYLRARDSAIAAPVGILNTAYALASWNHNPTFKGRELVVADESDLLERELMGFVEIRVPRKVVAELGVDVPKKGSHMPTIRSWLVDVIAPGVAEMVKARKRSGLRDVESVREVDRFESLVADVLRVQEREDGWVRDGGEEDGDGGRRGSSDGLVLKPVHVGDLGDKYLWSHADRWLCMTGTLVSAEMEAEALGLEDAGIKWDEVRAGMQFPVENRRVVYVPAGKMTRKSEEEGLPGVLRAVEVVLEAHPGVNVLVHTHTYKLAEAVSRHVKRCRVVLGGRPVITYQNSWGRDDALGLFKGHADKGGSVLVAASMDRGVDLPGDLCRVQVIVKVPFASLGDRQVSARMSTPGGQLWYQVGTTRTIMQMTGRAVRGMDDYAVTYVLDESFGKVYGEGRRMGLWPEWWMDGVEVARLKDYT